MASKPQSSISPASLSRRWALVAPSLIALAALGRPVASGAADPALKTRKPTIQAFERLWVNVPAEITVEPAEEASISITAEQKVLDAIKVSASGAELRVETSGSFQTQKPITIRIGAPDLAAITALGSCDITVSGRYQSAFELSASEACTVSLSELNLASLKTDITGSSEVQMAGEVEELILNASDASSFDGASLKTQNTRVEVSGASEAHIDVRSNLIVKISDAASVFYAGEPNIEQSVSFAGTLEPE